MKLKAKKIHTLQWVIDLLSDLPFFSTRSMFGCIGVYINGLLVIVLADRTDPWNGILICTDKSFHLKLQKKMKALSPHPVLGKWLYLPSRSKNMEETIFKIVELIRVEDPSIGV